MFIYVFAYTVCWLVCLLVGWLVGWWVGWLASLLVGWLVGWLLKQLFGYWGILAAFQTTCIPGDTVGIRARTPEAQVADVRRKVREACG